MSIENSITQHFPNLTKDNFRISSPEDIIYNCIAWAASKNDAWWWPDPLESCYWPEGIPRDSTVSAFVAAYGLLGFEKCENPDFEDSYEKIAIFGIDDVPKHAARQLDSGLWTSKLGQSFDIEHRLQDLCGHEYGEIIILLKRKKYE